MASSTRQSLASARAALQPLLANAELSLASQLFAVAGAVAGSAQLRNLLSDPSAEEKAKSGAVSAVFGKSTLGFNLSADVLAFVTSLVALRWSKGSDLVSALEQLGVYAAASVAAKNGSIETLANELFAFQAAIESDSELQFAFASKTATNEARLKLVTALVGNKVSQEAQLLINQAVVASGKRRTSVVLDHFGKYVAQVAQQLVATVTVAQDIQAEQLSRIQAALSKKYGASVKLNVQHDPSIIGGVRIQIADEIIDGSLISRLNQAKLSPA